MPKKICDFHMHSFFSDGELIPSEIVRRTYVLGHRVIAITDHADASNLQWILSQLTNASAYVTKYMPDFYLLPGVELTHVHPDSIPTLAREAKKCGAKIVVVHGETPVEPVQEGTDLASCRCPDVDILAHPGLISEEAVIEAKETGVFLELSFRGGHCLANGHVARLAEKHGAQLVVDSDAHNIGDHLTFEDAMKVAQGSGLTKVEAERVVLENPDKLLRRAGVL